MAARRTPARKSTPLESATMRLPSMRPQLCRHCVVLTRRRNSSASKGVGAAFRVGLTKVGPTIVLPVFNQTDAPSEILKGRMLARFRRPGFRSPKIIVVSIRESNRIALERRERLFGFAQHEQHGGGILVVWMGVDNGKARLMRGLVGICATIDLGEILFAISGLECAKSPRKIRRAFIEVALDRVKAGESSPTEGITERVCAGSELECARVVARMQTQRRFVEKQ